MLSSVWDGDQSVNQEYGCTSLAVEPYWAQAGCNFHCGVDIGSPGCAGLPLYAARAGTVTASGFGYIRISPAPWDGDDWYLHGIYSVGLGQAVTRRQQIGVFSDRAPSGGYVTGPHLHFEVQDRGWMNNPPTSRDPIPFLAAAYSAESSQRTGGFGTLTDIEIQARFVDLQNRLDPIGSGVRFTQFGLYYDENAPDLPDGSKPSVFAQLFHKQIRKEVAMASGSWTAADQQELDDIRSTVHQHINDLAADRNAMTQAFSDLRAAIASVSASLNPAQAQQLQEAHDAIVKAAGIISKDLAP